MLEFYLSGVKMFFVSDQGHVTTLSQPQTLHAYQFVNHQPGKKGQGQSWDKIFRGLYQLDLQPATIAEMFICAAFKIGFKYTWSNLPSRGDISENV